MANTTLVLNFFNQLVNAGKWPGNYIDANLRTDYAKIRHLVTLGHRLNDTERKLNGNFTILEKLISGGSLSEFLIDSFQARDLVKKENFRVRDSIDGEKTVQSTVVALLCAAAGPYFVHHEGEAGGGFYDIALEPQLSRWPDIAHAALIELKYLKPGDPEPTPEALAAIKTEAIEQLDQYSADPALAAKCHLKRDASSLKARSADSQPAGQYRNGKGYSSGASRLRRRHSVMDIPVSRLKTTAR